MKHKLSLHQRMLQKMALTPQMKQSIQFLTMPTAELNEYVDSLLEKNPFLKKEVNNKEKQAYAYDVNTSKPAPQEENPRLSLLSQLRMLALDGKTLEIAEYLIYELDDNGYLEVNAEEIAGELFANADDVEKVISLIQTLDPPGIGARDVRECLELQLKRKNKEHTTEYKIVTDFINELVVNDINKISEELNMDRNKIIKAIETIKKLNPRPAATILGKEEKPVIPDLIANIKKNKVRLELNRDWLPRLKLYNPYEKKEDILKDEGARDFLKENMNAAKQLIDSLNRREDTMCRVADYILRFQKDFLAGDLANIKSLTIRDIADGLNLHPSTISRTVSNKYIQIHNKIIPLKILLSQGIKKENGELTSKTSVKNRIKEIVDSEDKAKPLSDDVVRGMLERDGIAIKRRTVAKYRESLKILPTHLRKKKFII